MPALVPALAVPVLVLAINAGVALLLRHRCKDLRVHIGNRDIGITVPAVATAEDVASAIDLYWRLEERIRDALEQWRRGRPEVSFREGINVDFLAWSGERRIAIEIRTSLAGVAVARLMRNFDREGAAAVFVVSPAGEQPSPDLLAEVHDLPGHLEFVQIPVAGSAGPELMAALDRLLPAPAPAMA